MPPVKVGRRDIILQAFATECPTPSAGQVREWAARHPECAEDFAILAAIAVALVVRTEGRCDLAGPGPEPHQRGDHRSARPS